MHISEVSVLYSCPEIQYWFVKACMCEGALTIGMFRVESL